MNTKFCKKIDKAVYFRSVKFHCSRSSKDFISAISDDFTFHYGESAKPLYDKRFKMVQSFHFPEKVAAVLDFNNQAYHIDINGNSIYAQRFEHTYGFYANRAAVSIKENEKFSFFHINILGNRCYKESYDWVGNYTYLPFNTLAQVPVRTFDKFYYHINQNGEIIGGPYLYAGDPNSQGQSIVWDLDGECHILNSDRSKWGYSSLLFKPNNIWIDAQLPHKGIAAVKDIHGWYFINNFGEQFGGYNKRYLQVEPFYNGQARVKLLHGQWVIINETGSILHHILQNNNELKCDLINTSQLYWKSIALKKIIDLNLLEDNNLQKVNPTFFEILKNVSIEMNIHSQRDDMNNSLALTSKGSLLKNDNITRDRCSYWLQERYFKAWLLNNIHEIKDNIFEDISKSKELVKLSQNVLESYAKEDWNDIYSYLSLNELLIKGNKQVIVDIAGGTGSLLRIIERNLKSIGFTNVDLICFERKEVVEHTINSKNEVLLNSIVKYVSGDMFQYNLIPKADLYLLSRVLHDWNDDKVLTIIENIAKQSSEKAKLIIIDRCSTNNNTHAFLLLHMYMLQKSFERSTKQWENLFEKSKWKVINTSNYHDDYNIISLQKKNIATYYPRKAIIPIAGLGTRMYPHSLIIPKALLPICLDYKGNNQPVTDTALKLLLDQLLEDMNQIYIIISPSQRSIVESFLRIYEANIKSNNDYSSITNPANTFCDGKISLLVQEKPLGLGDAILTAENYIKNESFIVALGDHIFTPNCLKQLLNAYQSIISKNDLEIEQIGLTGACLCTEHDITTTGLLKTNDYENIETPSLVVDMIEKPSNSNNLIGFQVGQMINSKTFLSQLGIDILPSSIFATLADLKKNSVIDNEIDLRIAMKDSLQKEKKLYTCVIKGNRFDLGNPTSYLNSLNSIYNSRSFMTDGNKSYYQHNDNELVLNNILNWLINKENYISESIYNKMINFEKQSYLYPIYIASSPGRVDIMGGFADYSGSCVLETSTACRTYALIMLCKETSSIPAIEMTSFNFLELSNKSLECHIKSKNIFHESFPMSSLFYESNDKKKLVDKNMLRCFLNENYANSTWISHIIGVIHSLLDTNHNLVNNIMNENVSSIKVVTLSDIPWKMGLSSSAAIQMSVACAFGNAINVSREHLNPKQLATLCSNAENQIVGSYAGNMDQLTVGCIPEKHFNNSLLFINCKTSDISIIAMPQNIEVISLDSGVERSINSDKYKNIRIASMMGLKIINESMRKSGNLEYNYLSDINPSLFSQVFRDNLPQSILGSSFIKVNQDSDYEFNGQIDGNYKYLIQEATAFPIEENFRVLLVQNILSGMIFNSFNNNSVPLLKDLFVQSHISYSKCGLGTKETDILLDLLLNSNNNINPIIGAKISGGGGGGSVVVLFNKSHENKLSEVYKTFWNEIQSKYYNETGLKCTIRKGNSGPLAFHGHSYRSFSTLIRPRVLYVNHGYPPNFNGGSEVYAQTLALEILSSGDCNDVQVFAREHDPYRSDYEMRTTTDEANSNLMMNLVNYPREAPYYRFVSDSIDNAFRNLLHQMQPDIVHFHHLNHLSLNLPSIVKSETLAKTFYTIHDYWLMCPRGQFLMTGATSNEPWKQCYHQNNEKCAKNCFISRYSTGNEIILEEGFETILYESNELSYWSNWIDKRMKSIIHATSNIDTFIAPSKYLLNKFIQEFNIAKDKILFQPYGIDHNRLLNRKRIRGLSTSSNPYIFGYIGRHQPAKGINILVEATLKLIRDYPGINEIFKVKIYSKSEPNSIMALNRMIQESGIDDINNNIEFCNPYNNFNIVQDVFNHIDIIVVPSIWEENSPIAILEAQQCKIPVITSDFGGMKELVEDNINGLLFKHRDATSLAEVMLKAINQSLYMNTLGQRGYLYNQDGQVPSIRDQGNKIINMYKNDIKETLDNNNSNQSNKHNIPIRITFDTNPDDCNFSCTMCEQHSEFSPHQKQRKLEGKRRRRMDFNLIEKVLKEMVPLGTKEVIPTTMGEPLQYKEFPNLINLCNELNIKMNLTTNGSFYGRGVDQWARLIIPITSDVKFSWNGATEQTQQKIMKGSKLSTQLVNLKHFIKIRDEIASTLDGNRCNVTLQLTFMEDNLNEIPDIIALAIDYGCDRVKGHHLWAHFNEIKKQNLRKNEDSINRWNEIAKQCRDYVHKHKLANGKYLILENFIDLKHTSDNNDKLSYSNNNDELIKESSINIDTLVNDTYECPFLGKEAWINHEGRFDPCCAPDEQRKSLGSFGNINDISLLDIWTSKKYKDLMMNYKSYPLCKTCTMRKPIA